MTEVSARSRQVAAMFDQVAPTYEAVGVPWFNPISERLVDEVAPIRGSHALDIGCGRGGALASLSAAVGPVGRVTGIDLSRGMLEKAKHAVQFRGLHNVELYLMDATAPPLPKASFNAIVSSLVAFFLPDPAAALRNWHDLLVPMGRLGITTFGERDREWQDIDALFQPYLSQELLDARTTGSRGPFANDDAVADLVKGAGFEGVHTVKWDLQVHFRDADHWRTWSMSLGQSAMWQSVPEDERDGLLSRAAAILEQRRAPDGRITMTQTVRMTLGMRSY